MTAAARHVQSPVIRRKGEMKNPSPIPTPSIAESTGGFLEANASALPSGQIRWWRAVTAAARHVQSPVIQRKGERKNDFADYDCDFYGAD